MNLMGSFKPRNYKSRKKTCKTNKDKYIFDKNDDVYLIKTTKEYIVTNWDYRGVLVLNRSSELVKKIFINKKLLIDKIYKQDDTNLIALYCPENLKFIFVNLQTKFIEEISTSDFPELQDGCLTNLYYWKENDFIVQSIKGIFFSIDLKQKAIMPVETSKLAQLSLDFHDYVEYISKIKDVVEIKTFFADMYQFTYYDSSARELGLIDTKNNYHLISSYYGDDIHDIYFMNDFFVVVNCDGVEKIEDKNIETLITSKNFYEFGWSDFDPKSNRVFVLSSYRKHLFHKQTILDCLNV